MKGSLADLIVFGRVLSLGFLVGGTVWLSVLISRWLVARGCPQWTGPVVVASGVVLALLAGWREIRGIMRDSAQAKRRGPSGH